MRRIEQEAREKMGALGERPALEREGEFPEIERSAMECAAQSQSPIQSELHFPQMHIAAPCGSSPVASGLLTIDQPASPTSFSLAGASSNGPSFASLVRAISSSEASEPSGPSRGSWARTAVLNKKENAGQPEPEPPAQQTDTHHSQLDFRDVLSQALGSMQLKKPAGLS